MDDFEDFFSSMMGDGVTADGFWLEPDFLLSDIVRTVVNVMGAEIGVTLFMRGMVLTGTIVSEQIYLSELTRVFRERFKAGLAQLDEDAAKAILEALDFRDLAETSVTLNDDDHDDDNDEVMDFPAPIRYMHLRDVTVLSPMPSITFWDSILPIMRVRLTSLDGWLLGQSVEEPPEDQMNPPGRVLH